MSERKKPAYLTDPDSWGFQDGNTASVVLPGPFKVYATVETMPLIEKLLDAPTPNVVNWADLAASQEGL